MSTSKISLKDKARVSGTVTENCVLPNQLKEKWKSFEGRNDILIDGRSDSS